MKLKGESIPFSGETGTKLERGNRRLVYTDSLKELVKAHPHVFEQAIEVLDSMKSDSSLKEGISKDGTIKISRVEMQPHDKGKEHFFKVEVDGKSFFVKSYRQDTSDSMHGGFREAMSTESAREKLRGIPGVRVVKAQLGYFMEDKTRNNYFVTGWEDLKPLSSKWRQEIKDEQERNFIEDKIRKIRSVLETKYFYDIGPVNMFYDPTNGDIVLFDLMEDI